MDLATVVTAVASSLGIGVPAATFLSRSLFEHRLTKEIESYKSRLEEQRQTTQALLGGEIKKQVESALADAAAQRQYELEARRRLYTAIGPLRLQLLLACRELAGRIEARGAADRGYSMSMNGYYGRSTLFRVLRPVCLTELIERQIAIADFSVDPAALDLLRFRKGALSALSGDLLVHNHPSVNWRRQVEHVFADNLANAANALVVVTGTEQRAMRFHEFEAFLGAGGVDRLAPFPRLLEGLTPSGLPLLWLRLVGYAALCNQFINHFGGSLGFERRTIPVRDLLAVTGDQTMLANLDDYVARCHALQNLQL